MEQKRLMRSNKKMIAGVCAGIAEKYGWDPSLVRILCVLLVFITAFLPLAFLYLIFWIIIPINEGNDATIV